MCWQRFLITLLIISRSRDLTGSPAPLLHYLIMQDLRCRSAEIRQLLLTILLPHYVWPIICACTVRMLFLLPFSQRIKRRRLDREHEVGGVLHNTHSGKILHACMHSNTGTSYAIVTYMYMNLQLSRLIWLLHILRTPCHFLTLVHARSWRNT